MKDMKTDNISPEYHYYAFISYNRTDEQWAKWLHKKIEYFHIPSEIRRKHLGIPKKIRPVFWYKQDLSGTVLKPKLNAALNESKYLIVICSPAAALSEWVDYEVKEFIRQGKKKYIIPVIVDGNSQTENDFKKCQPPALRSLSEDEQLRYIDIHRKEGKTHALTDIIATILDVRFDLLWQRYRKYRNKIRTVFVMALLLPLLCLAGIYEYQRTKVEYYTDYIEGRYIPGQQTQWLEGIGKLTPEEADTAKECFRFEYKRIAWGNPSMGHWQLQQVVHQNSFGHPTGYEEQTTPFVRYPILRIKYQYIDSLYRPERIECYNEYNNLQQIKKISGEKLDKIDFQDFKTELAFRKQTLSEFKDPLLEQMGNKYCNITRFDLYRNNNGYINAVVFKSSNAQKELPKADARRHWAMIIGNDSLGRIINVGYISYRGYADYYIEYAYHDFKLHIKRLWGNTKNNTKTLVQQVIYKYNANFISQVIHTTRDSTFLKTEFHYDKGILQKKRTLKLFGKYTEKAFITEKALPLDNVKYEYTENGYVNRESILDMKDSIKYQKIYTYTADNRISSIRYVVRTDNGKVKPTWGPEHYHRVDNKYEKGLLITQSFVGYKGKYHIRYEYDNNKRLISTTYYNELQLPAFLGDFGHIVPNDNYESNVLGVYLELLKLKYAEDNRLIKGDTIHSSGCTFPLWDYYTQRKFSYDELGNITRISYSTPGGIDFLIIEEDILENGAVPTSIGYIINSKGQKLPLAHTFRSQTSSTSELDITLISILLENIKIEQHTKKD